MVSESAKAGEGEEPQVQSVTAGASGMRFSLSNLDAYMCEHTDFSGGAMGYHLPGEMGGLWYPPVRILKNITFAEGIQPGSRFHTAPDMAALESGTHFISFSMPEGQLLGVRDHGGSRDETMHILFRVSPISVWTGSSEPSWTLSLRGGEAVLEIENPSLRVRFVPSGTSLSVEGDTVAAAMCDGSSVLVTAATGTLPRPVAGGRRHMGAAYSDALSLTRLECGNEDADYFFYWSKAGLARLVHRQPGIGTGLAAGLPDFPWYFGLDTFVCMDALLETGMWETARESLRMLTDYARRQGGRVPHEIVTSGTVYNPGDIEESAMLPAALLKYLDWTGDSMFAAERLPDAIGALNYVAGRDFVGPGAMEDEERGNAVEIDTLSYFAEGADALRTLACRLGSTGRDDRELDALYSMAAECRRRIRGEMWLPERKLFANRIIDGVPVFRGHWTTIVPFVTGVADPAQYAAFAGSAGGGLASVSAARGMMVDGKGRVVMPVLNGFMSIAAHNYGDYDTQLRFYRHNMEGMDQYMTTALPEILDREGGCYLQAWSAAMGVDVLLRCFLGLSVSEGRPSCAPLLRPGFADSISVSRLKAGSGLYTVKAEAGSEGGTAHVLPLDG